MKITGNIEVRKAKFFGSGPKPDEYYIIEFTTQGEKRISIGFTKPKLREFFPSTDSDAYLERQVKENKKLIRHLKRRKREYPWEAEKIDKMLSVRESATYKWVRYTYEATQDLKYKHC
jgi:hypothetical protein